jgi:hypothetical protein
MASGFQINKTCLDQREAWSHRARTPLKMMSSSPSKYCCVVYTPACFCICWCIPTIVPRSLHSCTYFRNLFHSENSFVQTITWQYVNYLQDNVDYCILQTCG